MKFTVTKRSYLTTFMIEDEKKPVRRLDVPIDRRLFVKNKPPTKEQLIEMIKLQCLRGDMTKEEFMTRYTNARKEDIDRQTRELLKCYLRIRNSISCIDLADEIRLADEHEQP